MVDIRLIRKFSSPLPLPMLRTIADLAGMELLRKGSRLSVQPVTETQFKTILDLAVQMEHPATDQGWKQATQARQQNEP